MIRPGDRVRLIHRSSEYAKTLGDCVVTVVGQHPVAEFMLRVQGPSGAKVWEHQNNLYKLKESTL
ncbi:MAG: hypothetical protein ACE5D3_04520 [Candidatus Binatia bacterium]